MVQPLWKSFGGSSEKVTIDLPYDPAMPLLDIYSKENRDSNRYLCNNVHNSIIHNSQKVETTNDHQQMNG